MRCEACNAEVPCKANGRSFWKPVTCNVPLPFAPAGVERRECEHCGQAFCIRRFRPQRFCSTTCRGAAVTAARIPTPFFSWSSWRWMITPPGTLRSITLARHLMQCELDRELHRDEVVHHIDGDQMNDVVENLIVLTRAEHALVHEENLTLGRAVLARKVAAGRR